ncbi:FAD binding domain-containing protein [Rhizobium sp. CF142]|uniref:FAD binding domain-containing protein n=1 Tax=Rhizobium sp. CF142 TaxID=1144314 RepID=UPI00026EE94B|nr:xanthine dehydrogenase family protein subunit M [Rhizobium sp. CF142]EJJ31481.1 aerobic-type carbon monoxide dehydrogenase, middle subunit CoxM/CutM-like protein [Rhizobium sp. CF142]
MKPPPFEYRAPEHLDEVLALLSEYGPDARLLAGGQSLIPLLNLRMAQYDLIIDLNRCVELKQITSTDDGLSFGAMVRQSDAIVSPLTTELCPLVAKALERAGPIAVRNRATVGGTLAHADRSAELPGVAMALEATLVISASSGSREIPASEFFVGDMTTVIEPEELLISVKFPSIPKGAYTAFHETGVRREGVAIVGLAAMIEFDEAGSVRDSRLALTGVEPTPVRLHGLEEAIRGERLSPGFVAEVSEQASGVIEPHDDGFFSADYRRRVAASLVKRALHGANAKEGAEA